MKKLLLIGSVLLSIVCVLAGGLWLTRPQRLQTEPQMAMLLTELLNSNTESFAEADPNRPLRFPEDHGAHSEFRTETWYFNGSLLAEPNRSFGFQLTFFRRALAERKPQIDSAWAANQVYRAHLAVTDARQQQFYAAERYSRAALDLAGAQTQPVKVWLENWQMQVTEDTTGPQFTLTAADDDMALELNLNARKAAINGLAISGGTPPFQAYLVPRLSAAGELKIKGESFKVTGTAWLDHAWGLVPLGSGQLALNRFIIQLDDNREIMILQTRRRDGSGQSLNSGVLINTDGSTKQLRRRDIELEATDDWQSEHTGIRYPVSWHLAIAGEQLQLTIEPLNEDQELDLSLRYWAGTVTITGRWQGQPITGNGHIELSGYTQPP
jgi:predicted secreted hydrolase